VRKLLKSEALAKHLFLKSAQEYESTGFIFALSLQKDERVEHEGKLTEETPGAWWEQKRGDEKGGGLVSEETMGIVAGC
jgi:hypothetical protein